MPVSGGLSKLTLINIDAILTRDTDTFGLANLFQVLESNMGIIGACLPVMRQPLKQLFPRLFGASKSPAVPSPYYSDDTFANQYALKEILSRQRDGSGTSWHKVSLSGPELFKSAPRNSDELGIIHDTQETGRTDSGGDIVGQRPLSRGRHGIRKKVVVSVDRK